ncbi:structural protein [Salmonella phage Arash]|nr:structural protein [Salmonella phage Arash]
MSDLTVISGNMFISPGLVKTGELPVMDADISELEHKVSLLLQTYNNKLYEQTSWPWAGVTVPYAQNHAKGQPWGSKPVPGLLKYGEPIGAITEDDHLLGATPDAVRQVVAYFVGALPAQRTIQGKDLRQDIWINGEEVGSLTGEQILALAEAHRLPKELPGTDYAYVQTTKTSANGTGGRTKPIGRITALTQTSMTAEYKQFKVLVDGVWKLQ